MAIHAFARSAWAEHEANAQPRELHSLEEECWDEPESSEQRARQDLESLQGQWLSAQGRHQAEFLIAGGRFTIHFKEGVIYMGVFDLNVDSLPKTMDMRIDEGPDIHKGKTTHCIYELAGDTLRWCAARPGTREQFARFPSEFDPNYVCLTFRREKPSSEG